MCKLRFSKKELRDLRPVAFTFLYYLPSGLDPDVDPVPIFSFLDNLGFPSCISPLHDSDLTEDGSLKKPHYHVVIDFGSKKSLHDIYSDLDPILDQCAVAPFHIGNSSIESCIAVFNKENRVRNMRSLLRYFTHLDHPDKAQYDPYDIKCFCGFDFEGKIFSQADTYALCSQMQDFIRDNDVFNYADLVDYCRYNNYEWYIILFKSSVQNNIFSYLKSNTFRNTGGQDKQIEKFSKGEEYGI